MNIYLKQKIFIDEKKCIFQLYQNDIRYIMRFKINERNQNAIDADIYFCKW